MPGKKHPAHVRACAEPGTSSRKCKAYHPPIPWAGGHWIASHSLPPELAAARRCCWIPTSAAPKSGLLGFASTSICMLASSGSCYASMATLAREAEVCERVCWNAIRKAASAGYILRRTSRRDRGSKYKVTHVAIHPIYLHDHAESSKNSLHNLSKTPCTILPNNLLEGTFREEGSRLKGREAHRVFVEAESPQWAAWQKVKRTPKTDHRVNGRSKRGWWFDAEWPPGAPIESLQ